MRQRKVTVTLELETDAPLKDLRSRRDWVLAVWRFSGNTAVAQVTANVIQPAKAALVLLALLLATTTQAQTLNLRPYGQNDMSARYYAEAHYTDNDRWEPAAVGDFTQLSVSVQAPVIAEVRAYPFSPGRQAGRSDASYAYGGPFWLGNNGTLSGEGETKLSVLLGLNRFLADGRPCYVRREYTVHIGPTDGPEAPATRYVDQPGTLLSNCTLNPSGARPIDDFRLVKGVPPAPGATAVPTATRTLPQSTPTRTLPPTAAPTATAPAPTPASVSCDAVRMFVDGVCQR